MADRKFDVIVFGATGYTGKLVAEYLLEQYSSSELSWAMAGRSQDKLVQTRDELGASEDLALIVADSSDAQSMQQMAQQAKVILTSVGPYQNYGTELLAACAENGTDYVDLCGEPAWMHDTIQNYQEKAQNSGARIVHSCGFDSIPFDLGVYLTQKAAIEQFGGPCSTIRGRVRKIKGTWSGGTAASFMTTMARAKKEPEVLNWLKNPFLLTPGFEGAAQPTGHKPIEEKDIGSWSAPFMMASINTKNIHRSNVLLNQLYGESFRYDEMMLTGPGEQGQQIAEHVANSKPLGDNPPKPGEGPTKEERDQGMYDVMFIGNGPSGERIIAGVTGDKDPGYGSTAKMIAESAICLAQDIDRQSTPGGIYTPAPAMGSQLIERLKANAGMTFEIESSQPS